jgi:UDP-N-acetylmuramate dehydrogenase
MLICPEIKPSGPSNKLIQTNVPLRDKNWFSTGGAAKFFAQPTNAEEFQEAIQFAQANSLPIFLLGKGANILISDDGFEGLVIQPQLLHMSLQDEHLVKAGAGTSMHDLIEFCLSHNLIGLEEFSGIPGTVGGSVYINLHYFQFLLEQFLVCATVVHAKTGALEHVTPDWFNFGYDQSRLQEKEYYLVDATFKLKKVDDLQTAFAKGRRIEIIRHRASRYPTKNTCGSFFRNFHDHEVTITSNGKKMIFVAYYFDKLGVKGQLQVGGAIVSYQHANMLVNQGSATSADIITLARTMQEMVYKDYGIIPQPECQLIGFKEYPLMR